MSGAVVAEHPTITDSWTPRSERWLGRAPSKFQGQPDRPLFIGGCPRSGTTLLRSLLNNHPIIAIPPETNFLGTVWGTRARYGDLSEAENRRKLAEWIFDTPGQGGKRIRREEVFTREEAIERVVAAPPTLGSALAAVYQMFAEAKGKQRWGDKRPRYAGIVDAIFELFPDAQFINVIRDPRGAVASQIKLGWGSEATVLASASSTWDWSVKRVDRYARRLRPDQLLDVRYEDLVRAPEAILHQVCEFASLRHDDEAVDEMINEPRKGVFRDNWHERLSEPISTAPIDSWKRTLKPPDVALVERVLSEGFERFGYAPVPDLGAEPDPSDLEKYKRQDKRRRRIWLRYELAEIKRKRLSYRQPVAARPGGA